jgi:hypothetical protein
VSILRHLYYELKPLLPFGARIAFRRVLARRARARSAQIWPILNEAAAVPHGWPGWPGGKNFALVLTHDVESGKGISKALQVADLEEALGFRSSFNFVPEGGYNTPKHLRSTLVNRGFEVGVHDWRHDGKLYRSEKAFRHAATRINRYLHDWNAVGFRSGFMHHNLDWLHYLDIEYDMSTFDTDPFEPQPDGAHTIFPFWVKSEFQKRPSKTGTTAGKTPQDGYVELPYTLAQDSTLFLLLEERNPAIWCQKLDWIAQHGGMALLNVHPDYMNFDGSPVEGEYPAGFYADFLKYVLRTYRNSFWLALPAEMAAYFRDNALGLPGQPRPCAGQASWSKLIATV